MKTKIFSKFKIFFNNLSIVYKYLVGLISVVFIAAMIGYFVLAPVAQNLLQNAIGESSSLFAQEAINKIDRILLERINYWRVYSTEKELLDTLIGANKETDLITDLEKYIKDADETWINLGPDNKKPWMLDLFNNDESLDLRRLVDSFESTHGYRVFGEVFVTDRQGLVAALSNWTSDYYQADEQWWQETMEHGLYVSEVVFDESAQMRATEIGIRVDDKRGDVLGVIKVILNVEEAFAVVEELLASTDNELSKTLHAKILNKHQEIIYSSVGPDHTESILAEIMAEFDSEGTEKNYALLEENGEPGVEDEFIIWVESRGYEDFPGLGWTLLLEYDAAAIFAPVTELQNLFLAIILIAVVLLVFYSLYISHLITKPIKELLGVINRLREGEKLERATIRSNDEIGVLAQSFNIMADKLMEVDRLKTEFLSLATHQLRTPLGAMRWNLELILSGKKGKLSKDAKTSVEETYEGTLRLVSLINNLLDVSRIEQGKVYDKPEKNNLVELVDWVVKNMSSLAKEKQIKIDVLVEGKIPGVIIDGEKFKEVMENLVSNAIKYNKEKGSIKIKIKCIEDEVILSVKDTGIGILNKDKPKIFERFFRGENAASVDVVGTGLGLYVVREYLNAWGGGISFTSGTDGTEFTVNLPKNPKKKKVNKKLTKKMGKSKSK